MNYKIVLSNNNYYLFDDFNFFGAYHSIADAEWAAKHEKYKNIANLENYKFIKNLY